MAGFIRRYGFTPGTELITQIEGVVIVDLPPPGAITGVNTGTVACVGEYADMTYATAVDSSGNVTTTAHPIEVFTSQDMIDKVGGWDATLGDFGDAEGNAYASLRNKTYSRLVCVPVNLASSKACRAFRDLPTNLSATQPLPVVPLSAGRAEAGREFKSGANRIHVGAKILFTSLGQYAQGVDGSVTAGGSPTPTKTFNSAGAAFLTAYNGGPVPAGAIVVIGVIDGVGAIGDNAGTYRVAATASSDTALTLQKLDGSSFDWTTGGSLPYRVHPASDADTGTGALSAVSGYKLPARPLDATIAAATAVAPTSVPSPGTASTWNVLSGLTLMTHPTGSLVYTAAVQAPNAVNDTALDALYSTAIDALQGDVAPSRDVNVVFSSRKSNTIRTKLKSHVLSASGVGLGRLAVISPQLTTAALTDVIGEGDGSVGATRDERVIYCWPGVQTYVPEAANVALTGADGSTVTNGVLDGSADGWLASILSNLPPERNPGQAGPPVNSVMAPVLGLQRGIGVFGASEYTSMRAAGICGPRMDRTSGPIFQSGITSSLTTGQKNIARRRMADYIQDSVSRSIVKFVKQPLTQALKDSVVGEIDAFLNGLKSPNNTAAQRIVDYQLDDKSGNTPALEAQGIFVVIGRVRTLASADFIVFQTEVGEGVVITRA